jgi:ABC-type lipoprotein export system ATPase subunit
MPIYLLNGWIRSKQYFEHAFPSGNANLRKRGFTVKNNRALSRGELDYLYELRNVDRIVQDGKDRKRSILTKINLVFNHGELCCIRGETGAGKSTLLNILGGLDVPSTGNIYFEGELVELNSKRKMAYFRRNIGFVFQNYQLINHLSVYENVAMPLVINGDSRATIRKRVVEALYMARFLRSTVVMQHEDYANFIRKFSQDQNIYRPYINHNNDKTIEIDINTLLSEDPGVVLRIGNAAWTELHRFQTCDPGQLDEISLARLAQSPRTLSGGEKQRVAMARALVGNPKVLLADEPTAALDTNTAELILSEIISINKIRGITLIIVAHNPEIAKLCQRVITISGGLIVSDE